MKVKDLTMSKVFVQRLVITFVWFQLFLFVNCYKRDLSLEAEQKQLDNELDKTGLGFEYLNYQNLTKFIHLLELRYPTLVKVYSVGSSIEKRELWAMKITNTQKRPLGKPMFKYVANMHGDETVGRQLLVRLAWHLVTNYNKDDRVTKIMESIETHLLFSMNPDGFERAKLGECDGANKDSGRENAAGVDLNRDFPGKYLNSSYSFSPKRDEKNELLIRYTRYLNLFFSIYFLSPFFPTVHLSFFRYFRLLVF